MSVCAAQGLQDYTVQQHAQHLGCSAHSPARAAPAAGECRTHQESHAPQSPFHGHVTHTPCLQHPFVHCQSAYGEQLQLLPHVYCLQQQHSYGPV